MVELARSGGRAMRGMSFDRLAPYYRGLEFAFAGSTMQRCRTAWLDRIGPARRILIAGDGPGCFLVSCLRRFPRAEVTCLDISPGMLAQAQRQVRGAGLTSDRVEFVPADIRNWPTPAKRFDLLVTQFVLDCLTPDELEGVIRQFANAAEADAQWLVADFCVPASGWRRYRAVVVIGLLYVLFRWTTGLGARRLTAPDALLRRQGFELTQRRTFDWDMLHADLWQRSKS